MAIEQPLDKESFLLLRPPSQLPEQTVKKEEFVAREQLTQTSTLPDIAESPRLAANNVSELDGGQILDSLVVGGSLAGSQDIINIAAQANEEAEAKDLQEGGEGEDSQSESVGAADPTIQEILEDLLLDKDNADVKEDNIDVVSLEEPGKQKCNAKNFTVSLYWLLKDI